MFFYGIRNVTALFILFLEVGHIVYELTSVCPNTYCTAMIYVSMHQSKYIPKGLKGIFLEKFVS